MFKINFAYVYFYIGEMTKNLYLINKQLFYESNIILMNRVFLI